KYTDGIVLVVRAGITQKASLRVAYENIKTSGSKLLGVVINATGVKFASYYYYYYYYYTKEGRKVRKRGKRRRK
ncbi:MAG: hypothetical protein J7K79_06555, partial [Thermotoga sp.]|nr:hypothetical protein [Thermotoga sp.]